MSRFLALLRSEWLSVRIQIGLGIVFLASAWPKLAFPPVLAKNIHAYEIVPSALLNLFSLALPGVELLIGLALVLGIGRRGAALAAAVLLLVFMTALGINVLRDHPVHCSCFELDAAPKSCAELLAEMKWLIVRDVGLLLLAAHVLWAEKAREGPSA